MSPQLIPSLPAPVKNLLHVIGPSREIGINMIEHLSGGFHYNKASVMQDAPAVSGVYVLYSGPGVNDYVGEAGNIRTRLLQHISNEDNPLLIAAQPKYFCFVAVAAEYRLQVQNALILELGAKCNRKLG